MTTTTGRGAATAARVQGGAMGSEDIGSKPTGFGKLLKIQVVENLMTTMARSSQEVSDFCPSQKKHFFCGIAKKLGCQFCAPK